jgi:hypothetical protein
VEDPDACALQGKRAFLFYSNWWRETLKATYIWWKLCYNLKIQFGFQHVNGF